MAALLASAQAPTEGCSNASPKYPLQTRIHAAQASPGAAGRLRGRAGGRRRLPAGHARQWVTGFVRWYNTEHRHSAIRYVTPDQRHRGREAAILEQRIETYEAPTKPPVLGTRSGGPERPATGLRSIPSLSTRSP